MTGIELYLLLCSRVGNRYVFGARVPKNDPNWQGPWDCAEFASWGVYQATKKLYGCYSDTGDPAGADAYSGYWGRDAELIGKKISVDEAAKTPGAFIVRLAGNGMTGHLAVSNGLGGTIEAHSTSDGVIRSVVGGRRWDYGVQPPGIEYRILQVPQPEVLKPSGFIYRFMKPMQHNDFIKKIQLALKAAGYNPGYADGWFGNNTYNATRLFQLHHGLVGDGEVGPKTLSALHLSE
jgi:N-acetylmuramoyl-L-alanine amidase